MPGATVSGAGGNVSGSAASTGTLRAALPGPAFELKGCTATQDDVARLMSRLRLIDGVTRVTLADSLKQDASQAGTAVAAAPAGGAGGSGGAGCGANAPSFDLVVFFQPLPGASVGLAGASGPAAPTAPATSGPSSAPSGSTSSTPTAPSSSAATPQQQVSTTATTSTVPVTNGSSPAGGAK
jgi:hypothetical protein